MLSSNGLGCACLRSITTAGLWILGTAQGENAEVCRIQRDAPQWSITRFPRWKAVLNYRGSAGVCGPP